MFRCDPISPHSVSEILLLWSHRLWLNHGFLNMNHDESNRARKPTDRINVVDRLDRVWLWFCENAVRFLRRKERQQELERDLDSICNIKFKSAPHKQRNEAKTK